jgi:hypothetical protein
MSAKSTLGTTTRLLVALVSLALYGLSAAATASACPFMTRPRTEVPCSGYPEDSLAKEKSCAPEACLLSCPYIAEKAAGVCAAPQELLFISARAPGFIATSVPRLSFVCRAHTRDSDPKPFYLRNRALLI